jgi:S-DNA-T family DNA segregation ATPase FtsK/SpoIIIE
MNGPSAVRSSRLVEASGVLCLLLGGLATCLSLVSYHPEDLSYNTATGAAHARNLIGPAGAYLSDLLFQALGLLSFAVPAIIVLIAWRWLHGRPIVSPMAKTAGAVLLISSACALLGLGPDWRLFSALPAGGLLGAVLADDLRAAFNLTGAFLVALSVLLLSLYLATGFRLAHLAAPLVVFRPAAAAWHGWRAWRLRRKKRPSKRVVSVGPAADLPAREPEDSAPPWEEPPIVERAATEPVIEAEPEPPPAPDYIPIRALDDLPTPPPQPVGQVPDLPAKVLMAPALVEAPHPARPAYELPETSLLNEAPARNTYDEDELKQIAVRIKSKFEEFGVLGSVIQINPGPVVTTFEFKPEAGIKYNRITALNDDLCLGLQAESVMIERIPGRPTVGIEVPNSRRELISLRQMLESDEYSNSQSHLTIPLGKDINGRIKVSVLETMPHLLIAGSTGSGKSVMLNTLIMSVLYKSTPDEVRMILVDPKRLELGLYEGIPHLLTPVITDAKKAANALRNAVLEMERRLRLLASQGVRNIDQFNKKVRHLRNEPIPLFEEAAAAVEELEPLPYILILIDELADLMMVERQNVETSVTRLAQMARAVGMHLVLATQRPSVDVITGLIKANFPARLSFRVATRVDSRTVLDVMGAEHLLGKGDMLFLPPGSSRLTRVHGAFVTEPEINRVVEFWKKQAKPEYDQSFLIAPPEEEGEDGAPAEDFPGEEDPLYRDAVKVVLEMGKASTSTLQRRLRLGYGRAARILDTMQRDGIIGPPDGSKPRDVLKRPDWIDEIERERGE